MHLYRSVRCYSLPALSPLCPECLISATAANQTNSLCCPRSGAGKSTVASLLERLYSVDGGGIFLDGRDITEFSRAEWVAALTAVSQEPILFSGRGPKLSLLAFQVLLLYLFWDTFALGTASPWPWRP